MRQTSSRDYETDLFERFCQSILCLQLREEHHVADGVAAPVDQSSMNALNSRPIRDHGPVKHHSTNLRKWVWPTSK